MENELMVFDYEAVDVVTAGKLKKHETAIRNIQSKAVYEIGEELKAAHDELADHNGGTFYAWCRSIGFNTSTVKNILNYHEYVSQNLTNGDLIESLPKSLVYEAARPSTPQELKDGVANGDITSLQQFKKLKAELEATKNVLRTTETKLGEKDQQVGDLVKEVRAMKEEKYSAKNYESKAYNDAIKESLHLKEMISKQMEELEAVKKERDKFKNDNMVMKDGLAATRSNEERAQNNYDRFIREPNEAQAEAASLRETVRRQADELSERPQVEVEKRVEVVPEDYDFIKKANAGLHRRIAELEAHAKGMSLQELAEKDEQRKQYLKTLDEETEAAQQVRKVFGDIICLPDDEAEMRELARCYLDWSARKNETLEDARRTLQEAQAKLNILAEQFGVGVTLKVVK